MSFDYKRMMKREFNVGAKEQKVRLWTGIALLVVSVFLANILLLLVGVVLVVTARMQWCPVYSGLGKSSVTEGEEPAVRSTHH